MVSTSPGPRPPPQSRGARRDRETAGRTEEWMGSQTLHLSRPTMALGADRHLAGGKGREGGGRGGGGCPATTICCFGGDFGLMPSGKGALRPIWFGIRSQYPFVNGRRSKGSRATPPRQLDSCRYGSHTGPQGEKWSERKRRMKRRVGKGWMVARCDSESMKGETGLISGESRRVSYQPTKSDIWVNTESSHHATCELRSRRRTIAPLAPLCFPPCQRGRCGLAWPLKRGECRPWKTGQSHTLHERRATETAMDVRVEMRRQSDATARKHARTQKST